MSTGRADRKLSDLVLPSHGSAKYVPARLHFRHVFDHIQLHLTPKLNAKVLQQEIDWGTNHVLVADALHGALSQALRRPQSQMQIPLPPHSKLPFPHALMIDLVQQLCTVAQVLRIRRARMLGGLKPPSGNEAEQQSGLHLLHATGQKLYAAAKTLVEGFLPPKYAWLLKGWDTLNSKTPAAGMPTNNVFTLAVQIWLSVECRNANAPWELLREPQFSTRLWNLFQSALTVENHFGFPRVIFISPVYLGPGYTHPTLLVTASCAIFGTDLAFACIRRAYVTARQTRLSRMPGAHRLQNLEAQRLEGSGGQGFNRYPPQGHLGQAYRLTRTHLQPYQGCGKCSWLYRFAPAPGAIQVPCSKTFKLFNCAEDEWVLKAMTRK